jgi:hypothetical protein
MDELTLDDKKYISSKQAAKITGYAKDYVGQLCREGRVQARLVGRSWYVLESSIKDHRFGTDTVGAKSNDSQPRASVAHQPHKLYRAWESELKDVETYPSLTESLKNTTYNDEIATASSDQTPYKNQAWDVELSEKEIEEELHREDVATKSISYSSPSINEEQNDPAYSETDWSTHEEPQIRPAEPLGAHIRPYTGAQEHIPPRESRNRVAESAYTSRKKGALALNSAIRMLLIAMSLAACSIALANSGKLDRFIISATRDLYIAGISAYKSNSK